MRHQAVEQQQVFAGEVILQQTVTVAIAQEPAPLVGIVPIDSVDAEDDVMVRGPVVEYRCDLIARQVARVEHLHPGTIGTELRVQLVVRDRDMERLGHPRNGREAGRRRVGQQRARDGGLDVFRQCA